jgi:proteinaceous RNase P
MAPLPTEDGNASISSEQRSWKKFKKTELGRKVGALLHTINQSNRTQDLETALNSIKQLTDLSYVPSQATYATVLNLACSQGPERWPDVRTVLANMARHGVEIGEAGLSALIRLHMESGEADAALELLLRLEQESEQPVKRRAVLPLLAGVCEAGDADRAMHLVEIIKRNNIAFQEEEFVSLVALCGHPGQEHRMGMVLSEMSSVLYRVGPRLSTKVADWFRAQRWNVQTARISPSGVCSACEGQLQTVYAAAASVRRIKNIMERLIVEDLDGKSRSHELLHNTNIFRDGTPQGLRGGNLLKKFKEWLSANGPYEIIIDGANLGFHKGLTASAQGKPYSNKLRLDYQMIDDVMEQLASLRPFAKLLLVLHAQHVMPKRLKPAERAIVDRWKTAQRLYVTPWGMNDDWFWLYAALESSETRRATLLLSNDQMRDHQWAMNIRIKLDDSHDSSNLDTNLAWRVQEHKDFLRWQERHWATYFVHRAGKRAPPQQTAAHESDKLTSWSGKRGDAGADRSNLFSRWKAQFYLPLEYSVCIQALRPSAAVVLAAGPRPVSQRAQEHETGWRVSVDECMEADPAPGGWQHGDWQQLHWHLPLGIEARASPEKARSIAGMCVCWRT